MLPICGIISGHGGQGVEIGMNSRRLLLLMNSLKLGGMTAFICGVIALFAALYIRGSRLADKWYRYFFVLFLPIPYYIYALSWMYLTRFLGNWWPQILKYSMQGFGACVFVEVLTYLPIAVLFILTALEKVSADAEDMAIVYGSPLRSLIGVVLPEIFPYIMAAVGCIFTLSVTDFSVPSMFQYNTFALEIFSVYSRTGDAWQACVLAIPLVVILCLPIYLIAQGGSRIGFPVMKRRRAGYAYPAVIRGGMIGAFGVVCIQIVIPVITFILCVESMDAFLQSVEMINEQLLISIGISLIAAALTVILVASPAVILAKSKAVWAWMLGLITLAFPGALQAMGLLSVINGSLLHGVSTTMLLPALGCAIRYMPFALMVLATAIRGLDRNAIEMVRVMAPDRWSMFRLIIRMLLHGIICAAGIVFFLTLGEEGIMLVLMPPGLETASVKIYNYLHYGASQYVSGFCLVIVAVILLIEMVGVILVKRRGGRRG